MIYAPNWPHGSPPTPHLTVSKILKIDFGRSTHDTPVGGGLQAQATKSTRNLRRRRPRPKTTSTTIWRSTKKKKRRKKAENDTKKRQNDEKNRRFSTRTKYFARLRIWRAIFGRAWWCVKRCFVVFYEKWNIIFKVYIRTFVDEKNKLVETYLVIWLLVHLPIWCIISSHNQV